MGASFSCRVKMLCDFFALWGVVRCKTWQGSIHGRIVHQKNALSANIYVAILYLFFE